MKVAILGSCVTRDMVEHLPPHVNLVLYFARTSLISLVAEGVPVELDQIQGDREFNRKVVQWDMTKVFWEKLEESKPDVLILDFIDERFDLLKKRDAVVTRSTYLSLSGVEQTLLSDFELVRRQSPAAHELWKVACGQFLKRVSKVCKNVILHRSLWARSYYVDGLVKEFEESERALAKSANAWLDSYYDHFLSECPEAIEIRVEESLCVSDFAHKWGRDFFHYGKNYYKRLAELVTMNLEQDIFVDKAARYDALRSLDKWPSAKFRWPELSGFLNAEQISSGIHSIILDGGLVFDIYIDIKSEAPAYIYFHGNCPRAPNFKLPVFSGANVLESLNVTRIVPSDPVLLMAPDVELSWHAGTATCNLQEVYKSVFDKVLSFARAPEVVFWGGSGGGFAALYYSFFFPGSTAMVWNPQIDFLRYSQDAVENYLKLAHGTSLEDSQPVSAGIENDLAHLYKQGHGNRIIFIQNDADWHVEEHLAPFLDALGVNAQEVLQSGSSGLVAQNFYLFLGRFSEGHEPPKNVEIHCALQECFFAHGDPAKFNFASLVKGKHHLAGPNGGWVADALLKRRLAHFRPDWPHYAANPALDPEQPYSATLSTGVVIDFKGDGGGDWNMVFEKDISDNVHELYSLGYVGRLLSFYEEARDPEMLQAAFAILNSFFDHIAEESEYDLVMSNRGYSSADHSISIRANVCIKFLQVLIVEEGLVSTHRDLINRVVHHLWNIGDHFTDEKNIYPSNHGIMSCLTLAQIANQFGGLPYISNVFMKSANAFVARLIGSSFDRDGWCNENTVGYHSFICRLLRDYIEYCKNNKLALESGVLENYLAKGEQALEYCVRQDGSIPPIGDSPMYRTKIRSINSSKYFSESGFLLIKDDALHLALICGSRSDNHKQVDDSSFSLHYGGEDLIIDGGSYSYDYADPLRKYLISFRGHSGIFADAASGLSPRAYLKHRRYAHIDRFIETVDARFAVARYGLDIDGIECERRILAKRNGDIFISDRARATNRESVFNQSFLLAPQLSLVSQGEDHVVFEGEKHGLAITQINACALSIESGLTEPRVAGWHSIDWRKIEKTSQLTFVQHGPEVHYLTRLQIYEKGSVDLNDLVSGKLPSIEDLEKVFGW
ncbi:MAG: hypothetical protein E2591_05740 [Achromobacter sp.]|uniref:DUF6270 domain-containing protein n=1 Tax=Achromobacter sp. TaxID=134375 RepID=UPI0012BF3DCD|nr:hypothetical protein [Achromobacter sp.]